jgi:hypothetical protein
MHTTVPPRFQTRKRCKENRVACSLLERLSVNKNQTFYQEIMKINSADDILNAINDQFSILRAGMTIPEDPEEIPPI